MGVPAEMDKTVPALRNSVPTERDGGGGLQRCCSYGTRHWFVVPKFGQFYGTGYWFAVPKFGQFYGTGYWFVGPKFGQFCETGVTIQPLPQKLKMNILLDDQRFAKPPTLIGGLMINDLRNP